MNYKGAAKYQRGLFYKKNFVCNHSPVHVARSGLLMKKAFYLFESVRRLQLILPKFESIYELLQKAH